MTRIDPNDANIEAVMIAAQITYEEACRAIHACNRILAEQAAQDAPPQPEPADTVPDPLAALTARVDALRRARRDDNERTDLALSRVNSVYGDHLELAARFDEHQQAKPSEAHPAWLEAFGVLGPHEAANAAELDEATWDAVATAYDSAYASAYDSAYSEDWHDQASCIAASKAVVAEAIKQGLAVATDDPRLTRRVRVAREGESSR